MALVLDASFAAAWFLPDEQTVGVDIVMASLETTPGYVPALFWFEARNLFHNAERRGRLRTGEARLSMFQLRSLPLREEAADNDGLVLDLAERRNVSAYDASYLAISISLRLPLATLDRRLAAGARAEGVEVIGPFAHG